MQIVVVEPDSLRREALRTLLDHEQDFLVIAEPDVAAVVARARLDRVDVVVIDERVAGATSGPARSALAALSKRALVIVVGVGDPTYYEEAHVEAGAVGYWPMDGDVDVLIRVVRAAGLVAQAERACVASRRRRAHQLQRLPAIAAGFVPATRQGAGLSSRR